MAGHGGGAWKVAYADFVTAMMAFFMVMWITAQSEEVKEAISHHFNDPFAPMTHDEQEEDAEHPKPTKFSAPARPTHEEEEEAGGGGRSLLLVNQGGDRTSIGTIVRFADESAELDSAARRRLEDFVPYLLGKPQRVEIRGHSTRRPLSAGSPFRDHWQLAYARCLAVMAELEKLGVPRERMRLSQAAGNEPPATPDLQASDVGLARVEVNLLNETTFAPVSKEQRSSGASGGGRKSVRRTRGSAFKNQHDAAPESKAEPGAEHPAVAPEPAPTAGEAATQ
jgi:chemotaxis protein MotB